MIIETIVTTVAADGTVNCAPMGVEWDAAAEPDAIVLKPFLETATYRNVAATGAAVVNLTDDVRVFARAAISNPQPPTLPAARVRGVVLAGCCAWRELEVQAIDSTPPRSRIEARVVHSGSNRDFIGFNRAAAAVLETAIYATRLHLLTRDFVDSELARLQVIVDKTAGPRELEAMAMLVAYISDPKSQIPNPKSQDPEPKSQDLRPTAQTTSTEPKGVTPRSREQDPPTR